MATKQDAAVAMANQIIGTMAAVQNLLENAQHLNSLYTAEGYNAVWAALPTAAQNADGSLGTADGTPQAAHPIDTRVVASLQRAVSSNQLVQGIVLLQQFASFMTNAAVTQGNYQQSAYDLTG